MRSRADIEKTIDSHGDTIWRVCVLYFRQSADAQDAFQEAVLKYSLSEKAFSEEEHRKAWLIRVTTNICKDMLKAAHRRNIPLDTIPDCNSLSSEGSDIKPGSDLYEALDAIRNLSDPPRTPVYLALYEGYTAPEISRMLGAPVNTVYSWISRGKLLLREALR